MSWRDFNVQTMQPASHCSDETLRTIDAVRKDGMSFQVVKEVLKADVRRIRRRPHSVVMT